MTAPDGGPVGTGGPMTMLTDVIGRLAIAENRLSQLGGDLSEMGADQIDTTDSVKALATEVDRLAAAIAELIDAEEEPEADETQLVDWSTLDQTSAVTEWDRLYTWLAEVWVPTYRITTQQLPVCWPDHPAIREQLSWLRVAWAQAFRRPRGSGGAAGEWHIRWMPAVLDAIAGIVKAASCNAGKHLDQPLPPELRAGGLHDLSTPQRWLHAGRDADIRSRPQAAT